MTIASETGLTRQEMVLVHLMRFGAPDVDTMEMPFTATAYGMSVSLGISRQHVSKELRLLEGLGQVSHGKSNVSGNRCKMNAYVLEPSGMERAKEAFRRNPDALSGNIFPDETVNTRKARSEINEALRILDDRELNDEAIAAEQRGETTDSLFSMYHHTDGTEIYIITEWDRSVTTIMSPMSIDKPVTGRGPRTPCPHDDEEIQPPGSIISWDQHVIIPRIDDDR